MKMNVVSLPAFRIMGIAIRTSNQGGQSAKDIGELWNRFIRENIAAKIPDKFSEDVYCLYTDYEDGASGHYTTLIGCRVHSLEKTPENLIGKTIQEGTYQVFLSSGSIPEAVEETWKEIWQSGIPRKFIADFDVYGNKSLNPENAEVETYVSIP